MDDTQLYEYSSTLTDLARQLELVETILDDLAYAQSKGDKFSIHHFASTGGFSLLSDTVKEVKKKHKEVSNGICPDELNEEGAIKKWQ